MRMPIGAVAALAFLLLASGVQAEDWTTTDGKTYHNVTETGHNIDDVFIECQEGKVTVGLDVLPPDIRKRFGFYDAKLQVAMDAYIRRLKPAATPDDLHNYAVQLKRLLSDPSVLKSLTSHQLNWLLTNRLALGGYYYDKFPKADAADLRSDVTKLMGIMLMDVESKIDPSIDTTKPIPINVPPYEFVTQPEDRNDAAKRKAYEAEIAVEEKERDKEMEQMNLKREVWYFTRMGSYELRVLYGHPAFNDVVSIEGDVRPLLSEVAVDAASIDYLLGKTEYKVR